VGAVCAPCTPAHCAHDPRAVNAAISADSAGRPIAATRAMIWFLERNSDLVICEIRRTEDADAAYEFEVAATDAQPRTRRFNSPSELIDGYLREQAQLRAQGWRPRASDIAVLTE